MFHELNTTIAGQIKRHQQKTKHSGPAGSRTMKEYATSRLTTKASLITECDQKDLEELGFIDGQPTRPIKALRLG